MSPRRSAMALIHAAGFSPKRPSRVVDRMIAIFGLDMTCSSFPVAGRENRDPACTL
jgi:hypothetical protein